MLCSVSVGTDKSAPLETQTGLPMSVIPPRMRNKTKRSINFIVAIKNVPMIVNLQDLEQHIRPSEDTLY